MDNFLLLSPTDQEMETLMYLSSRRNKRQEMTRKEAEYLPTPDEIRASAAKVRKSWTKAERKRRRAGYDHEVDQGYSIPVVKTPDLGCV